MQVGRRRLGEVYAKWSCRVAVASRVAGDYPAKPWHTLLVAVIDGWRAGLPHREGDEGGDDEDDTNEHVWDNSHGELQEVCSLRASASFPDVECEHKAEGAGEAKAGVNRSG
jgi:hypothetical protein